MFVADNGSDWYVSGAPDPRWDDDQLGTIERVTGRAFEVVRMAGLLSERQLELEPVALEASDFAAVGAGDAAGGEQSQTRA